MNRSHSGSVLNFLLMPFFFFLFVLLILMQTRWQNRLAKVGEQGGDWCLCTLLVGPALGRVTIRVLKMKEKTSSMGRKEPDTRKQPGSKSQADMPVCLMEILT